MPTLKELLAKCDTIHKNLEPIKNKMLMGTATDDEIAFFSKEQDKSINLLTQAFAGKFTVERIKRGYKD